MLTHNSTSSSLRPLLLAILLFSATWQRISGYATYMTQSSYCSRSLTAGTQIMSHAAVSSTSRTISVTRNGVALNSGDAYVYGETLVASLSSTSGEYVIQVTGGASVTGGGCTKTRLANADTSFVLPTTGSSTISIVSGWTTAQNTPVGITPTFTLVAPAAVAANPSYPPTLMPTMKPNITPYPTFTATNPPTTTAVIVPPTSTATDDGSGNSNQQQAGLSSLSTPKKSWAGFMIALSIGGVLVGGAYLVAMYRMSHPDNRYISEKTYTFSRVTNVIVLVFAFFAVIMMSMWTKKSNSDYNYLDAPSWQDNLFAWHPVLMVCGFFVSQLGAIASWALFKDHFNAKITHVVCQLAGLSTMISGLWAVWEYKVDMQSYNYTTIHSWLGIATVAVYVFTFFWGSLMATLTRFFPDSILRKAFDLKNAHKNLGILALVMTTMSIWTGVMDQLPQGSCNPSLTTYEQDAGQYYAELPGSCKTAYGMAMFVLVASILSMFGIAYRGDSFGFMKPKTAEAVAAEKKLDPPVEIPMVDNPQRSIRSFSKPVDAPTRSASRKNVPQPSPSKPAPTAPPAMVEEYDEEEELPRAKPVTPPSRNVPPPPPPHRANPPHPPRLGVNDAI